MKIAYRIIKKEPETLFNLECHILSDNGMMFTPPMHVMSLSSDAQESIEIATAYIDCVKTLSMGTGEVINFEFKPYTIVELELK